MCAAGIFQRAVHPERKSLIEKMPLTAGDTFAVGGAQLRFVLLCGPEFNWNAAPKERK